MWDAFYFPSPLLAAWPGDLKGPAPRLRHPARRIGERDEPRALRVVEADVEGIAARRQVRWQRQIARHRLGPIGRPAVRRREPLVEESILLGPQVPRAIPQRQRKHHAADGD